MEKDLRKSFDMSLNQLKQMMIKMFDKVEEVYIDMFKALESMDVSMAQKIIDGDYMINEQETAVDNAAYLIILKQCPVASDLRMILSAIKIANNLERIADYATNSGMYIIKTDQPKKAYNDEILKYQVYLIDMLHMIKKAYNDTDVSLAFEVCEKDNLVDQLYQKQLDEFVQVAKSKTNAEAEEASRALLVIKQLERAGDHITNIAEQIIYLKSGKLVELN